MYQLKYISVPTEKYKLNEERPDASHEDNSFVVHFKGDLYARVSVKYDANFLLMFNPTVEIYNMDVDYYGKDLSVESFALKRSLNSVPDKELREICSNQLLSMQLALANLSHIKEHFDKDYEISTTGAIPSKENLKKKSLINYNPEDDDDGGVKIPVLN